MGRRGVEDGGRHGEEDQEQRKHLKILINGGADATAAKDEEEKKKSNHPPPVVDPESFARSYQLEALEKGMKHNTIAFLDTGSGKTLIAVMLLRHYAHLIRKPSNSIAVFLVPTVVLVNQQADVIEKHTDLKVGRFWGEMGVDFWSTSIWKEKLHAFEVFVMTPQILLNNLRHSFFKLENIKLLVFDECHHAKGKHPYACIMTDFYHPQLRSAPLTVPRIFGMTASLINSKGSKSRIGYQKHILELEKLMNSKNLKESASNLKERLQSDEVYTVANESILAEYISFSTPKIKYYKHVDIPDGLFVTLAGHLMSLKNKNLQSLKGRSLDDSAESAKRKIAKLHETFLFCLTELGVWMSLKAAETLSRKENDIYFWGDGKDGHKEKAVRNFSKDVVEVFARYLPHGWSIGDDFQANIDAGFLTTKVECLILALLEYSKTENLRCIIFVQRVITAIVLQSLLCIIPELSRWGTKYMAGNCSGLQTQSKKEHRSIVDSFRDGKVNIIVATQILEEGLDVQSCNLVVRFDPSPTVCSFIQSRGRARMQGSDYLLIVRSGDSSTLSKVRNYLDSGDMMREESLRLTTIPCTALENEMCDEDSYCVDTTGAVVTLSSSIPLIHFYCSRLPSDRYFKPFPRFVVNKESESCELILPKSCPIPSVSVEGKGNNLKQLVCLEACKKLHQCGALSDNLLPVFDVEAEDDVPKLGNYMFSEELDIYFPGELVCSWQSFSTTGFYHSYKISFNQCFNYDVSANDIIFVVKCNLGTYFSNTSFNLESDRGYVTVNIEYLGVVHLSPEEVLMARKFQTTILNIIIHKNYDVLKCSLDHVCQEQFHLTMAYLLLPSVEVNGRSSIDWDCVKSACFSQEASSVHCMLRSSVGHHCPQERCRWIWMKNGRVRSCMIQNSVVYTPHNNHIYSISGILGDLNGQSLMNLKGGGVSTYEKYFQSRHGITLSKPRESLLAGRDLFHARNFLRRSHHMEKESSNAGVKLPPELCVIILSPVNLSLLYSFSFLPSVMCRIESMLLVSSLNFLPYHCMQNDIVPAIKVLEATTTKKCRERLSLESLETLGDSFLKYVSSLHLFKRNQQHHQGILSKKRERIISNDALCHLACNRKLPGFIRNAEFDPKLWDITSDCHVFHAEDEIPYSDSKLVYKKGARYIKSKRVADVVEALIGAYLSTRGEMAALLFMRWLGMEININNGIPDDMPLLPRADTFVNIKVLESLLKYSFHNPALLVEALTHGSYQVADIPRCYQRLEFLGDAVLDYLITVHMYREYPEPSPGLITDLRSASANNDCYAHAAAKAGLNKHILHASSELHRQMAFYLDNFSESFSGASYGWDAGVALPKVLSDVIESIAGAIFVDSGYNKEIVWESIRPLLEPLVTPDTLEINPVRELEEYCSKKHYPKKYSKVHQDGIFSSTVEVDMDGVMIRETRMAPKKKDAEMLASKAALMILKGNAIAAN